MPRYAVLHDVTTEETTPVGIALEMGDHVLVHVPSEYGIPARHDGEYRVRQPNMAFVIYRPGDAGYFDQVLVDLSWAFGVGEQGVREETGFKTVLELMVEKVERERSRERVGEYSSQRGRRGRRLEPAPCLTAPYQADRAIHEDDLAIAARAGVSV
jgi:hypothetical protein